MFNNKKNIGLGLVLVLVLCSFTAVYAVNKNSKVIVVEEDYSKCEEFDTTNYELEDYFNSIDNEEKQELLRRIFYYYPIDLFEPSAIDSLDVLEQAKYYSALSIQELRDLVNTLENKLLNSKYIEHKN